MGDHGENTEEDTKPIGPGKAKIVRHIIQRPMEVDGAADTYNMTRKKRLAIIFNHNEFTLKLSRRPGTEFDVKRLLNILEEFHFTVNLYVDLSKIDLLKQLQDLKTKNFNDFDCLAIFVMSHGKENNIAAKDDYYTPDELWKPLAATECKTLAGKPKLVFINACRGNFRDYGEVEFDRDLTVDGCQNNTPTYRLVYNIPNNADIFVAYSTYDEHISHREPTSGSWFIQSLCDVLENEDYKKMEIKKILTKVTNIVALMTSTELTKQVPVTVSTLMRDLYLE